MVVRAPGSYQRDREARSEGSFPLLGAKLAVLDVTEIFRRGLVPFRKERSSDIALDFAKQL